MRFRPSALLLSAAVLSGCYQGPDWYAPPVQRRPLSPSETLALGRFIQMNHPSARYYILKDISDTVEAETWRWTYRRPELRFHLDKIDGVKLAVDFTISGATFEKTGPVTVAFYLNDRLFDTVRYTASGRQQYEKPVPREFLKPYAVNRVALRPDKVWTAPGDGAVLGVILTEAGFKR